MSDTNENDQAHAGFWNSWLGKIVALFGLIWLLPTDEIFNDVVEPGWNNAKKRMRNGWGHAKAAAKFTTWWLKRQTKRLLLLTLLVASVTGALLFIGLAEKNRALVVTSGLLWTVYLIALWILIKGGTKMVAGVIGKGTDISGSALASILKKVGLAEGDGEALKVKFGNIDAILAKGFVVLPGFAEAFFLLALMPSFSTLLLVAVVGLGVISSGLISAHIGDTMVDGWKLIKRMNFVLFVILGMIALVAFFLPQTFAKYADPGALDAWLVNPSGASWFSGVFSSFWGTVLGILAIGAIAWTVAGLIKGEVGERLTFAIMVATVVGMCLGGYRAWGSTSSHAESAPSSTEHSDDEDLTSQTYGHAPDPAPPSSGSANGMKMPEVDYKSGVSGSSQGSAKPDSKPAPVTSVSAKVVAKPNGDGYDRAEALLNEAGL